MVKKKEKYIDKDESTDDDDDYPGGGNPSKAVSFFAMEAPPTGSMMPRKAAVPARSALKTRPVEVIIKMDNENKESGNSSN